MMGLFMYSDGHNLFQFKALYEPTPCIDGLKITGPTYQMPLHPIPEET